MKRPVTASEALAQPIEVYDPDVRWFAEGEEWQVELFLRVIDTHLLLTLNIASDGSRMLFVTSSNSTSHASALNSPSHFIAEFWEERPAREPLNEFLSELVSSQLDCYSVNPLFKVLTSCEVGIYLEAWLIAQLDTPMNAAHGQATREELAPQLEGLQRQIDAASLELAVAPGD